jgi:hypothetical protein
MGLGLVAAREKVRMARALAELPRLSAAMERGALSYSKARALTRIATPENEQALLENATVGTASHIEKMVRLYRQAGRPEELRRAAGKRPGCTVGVVESLAPGRVRVARWVCRITHSAPPRVA